MPDVGVPADPRRAAAMRDLGVRAANPTANPAVTIRAAVARGVGVMTLVVSVRRASVRRVTVALVLVLHVVSPVQSREVAVGMTTAAESVRRAIVALVLVLHAVSPVQSREVAVGMTTAVMNVRRAIVAAARRVAGPAPSRAAAPVIGMTAVVSVPRAIAVARAGRDPGVRIRPEASARIVIRVVVGSPRTRAPGATTRAVTGARARVRELRPVADTPVKREVAPGAAVDVMPVTRGLARVVVPRRVVRGGRPHGRTRVQTARKVRAVTQGEGLAAGVTGTQHHRDRVAAQQTRIVPLQRVRSGTRAAPGGVATRWGPGDPITVTLVADTVVTRVASRADRDWNCQRTLISSSFREAFALNCAA